MKNLLPPSLVRNALSGHSWLGLLTGALMYLICLSGTLVVYYQYLERWEQPNVPEYRQLAPTLVGHAYRNVLSQPQQVSGDMLIMLPTEESPHAYVASSIGTWFLQPDGRRGEPVAHPWTDMLGNLHLYLHLPSTFGMVVVSAFGALLCALLLSGFLAHPRIFRDAFNLRLGGSRRLEQVDIHNRLSVWGAPFHLMIGITGAYFGLAALMNTIIAAAFFDGDRDAATGAIHSPAPVLQQEVAPMNVQGALERMNEVAPEAEPFYITIEDINTPGQYMIIGGRHHDRLIYGEQYRFDQQGEYLGKAGYTDGPGGQQAIFSTYRIHFGHFGGYTMLILYGVFGLALTVVSVSGINIWLARRKRRDYLNNLWTGLVWGTPPALALTALLAVLTSGAATAVYFWGTLVFSMGLAQWLDNDWRTRLVLQRCTAGLVFAVVAGHLALFGRDSLSNSAALAVNTSLLLTGIAFLYLASRQRQFATPYSSR
ncbi:MAG: PepSY-associated TM helix domain-containing protein [Pseudohongiellaceae bacterium]